MGQPKNKKKNDSNKSVFMKGQKGSRGVPYLWDELKKQTNFSITPTTRKRLAEFVKLSQSNSISEFLDRVMHGDPLLIDLFISYLMKLKRKE